jgi:hypothetical protein
MVMHLSYAFNRTLRDLEMALRLSDNRVIIFSFIITLLSFGAIQIAIVRNIASVSETIIFTCATAAVFFFSIVGFIAILSTTFIFMYYFSIGKTTSSGSQNRRWYVWRLILSFAFTGVVTGAVFNVLCDGLEDVSFIRTQYALFLSDGQ